MPPKKRGRKPKDPNQEKPDQEKYVPSNDLSKRGIMAEGGCALRNRQNIKSSARYSPPPFDTPTRSRTGGAAGGGPIKFPSTSTTKYKYIIGSDGEGVVNRELNITTPTSVTMTTSAVQQQKIKIESQFMKDIEVDDDGALENYDDDEYKPNVKRKRKTNESRSSSVHSPTKLVGLSTDSQTNLITVGSPTKPIATYSRQQPKQLVISRNSIAGQPATQTGNSIQMTTAKPARPLPLAKTNLPPQAASSGAPRKSSPGTSGGSKYIDSFPELNECTNDIDEPGNQMAKLPDKIIFVQSELPLSLALTVENEDKLYLFRQVLSPVEPSKFHCLLCKSNDLSYVTQSEYDIINHYKLVHELEVETGSAKFSEEIVFICLPKQIIAQLTSNQDAIPLNAPCQYCGEEAKLLSIDSMKNHYSTVHNKQVIMIEQEEIIKMHNYFYCCKCKNQSSDFEQHHKHMKEAHAMKSYKCKSCILITNDVTRLKTHFKAKHLINNSGPNQQCYYCQGLLIGLDRLSKHIQQTHMVQTGPMEYSCVACLRPCGKGKDLLAHAQTCDAINKEDDNVVDKDKIEVKLEGENDVLEDTLCTLCGQTFDSQRICDLHHHHVHMKWISTVRRVVIPGQQVQVRELTINDVTSESDLIRAKVDTVVGHWCRMCDCMVKVYRLFYLHMANYHKLDKGYQCNINSCKAQFDTLTEFEQHIEQFKHNQKSIINHSDEVSVCTYCDLYFANDDDLLEHLLTDQHINKFTTSGHFHRTEPRNYKCKACHTFFGMKESYIHHLETENHQYKCPYCGMTTALPSSRRAHIQNSHPEKVNFCEICGQQQSDVLAHLVQHGFAFECKKCIKKFYWREQLNAHQETHADPITCNWENCGKVISTRSAMVTHYRQHKSDHKCEVCGQAFWNQTLLVHHQRSHFALQKPTLPGTAGPVGRPRGPVSSSIAVVQGLTDPVTIKNETTIGTIGGLSLEEAKVLELAAKAATSVSPSSTRQTIQTTSSRQGSTRQKTSTRISSSNRNQQTTGIGARGKQAQQPVIDLQAIAQAQGISDEATGTQVIMILNQETGELMEITAPQGMAVSDVINSLNLVTSSSTDVTTVTSNSIANNNSSTATTTAGGVSPTNEEASDSPISAAGTTTQQSQEQTIMLPASAFNEDGSLTLDAATLSSLNLTIAVDSNGETGVVPDGGNGTTFIIADTGNAK